MSIYNHYDNNNNNNRPICIYCHIKILFIS